MLLSASQTIHILAYSMQKKLQLKRNLIKNAKHLKPWSYYKSINETLKTVITN